MRFFKSKIKVVTHNGRFHADEIFALATLSIWAQKNKNSLKIIRTRDSKIIEGADMVVDVGGVDDADRNRFDHHQIGGAGSRVNNVPYASFGLVWKKYGEILSGNKEAAGIVERNLVMPVDARDNGINITKTRELGIYDHRTSNAISDFNPTWQEGNSILFSQFIKAFEFAIEILKREIALARAEVEAQKVISNLIKEQNNPEILILDFYVSWEKVIVDNKNTKIVVYPSREGDTWSIQSAKEDLEDYNSNRINLPNPWWGLRDESFIKESGVKDAVFCIKNGWLAKAKSKEGAVELAEKALRNAQN